MTVENQQSKPGLEPVDENVGKVVATVVEMLQQSSDVLAAEYPNWSAALFSTANLLNEQLPE